MTLELTLEHQSWPIAGSFAISRGSKTTSEVVVAGLSEAGKIGWGECVPYARYGESIESVMAQIESLRPHLDDGLTFDHLQSLLPAGAARNAVDCALHDLRAKQKGCRVWELLDTPAPEPVITAYTLSLGTAADMEAAARTHAHRPLLKVKLGGDGDEERMRAVRAGAPDATIIVDANEAWSDDNLEHHLSVAAEVGIAMIEQPLHAERDRKLAEVPHPVPICADEACHDRTGLADLKDRYDLINIKLDKTGGLSEAVAMARKAGELGFGIMVGCMLGTSLGMAPAMLLQPYCRYIDLDGPLLLQSDREPGLDYKDGLVLPPENLVWG